MGFFATDCEVLPEAAMRKHTVVRRRRTDRIISEPQAARATPRPDANKLRN